MLAPCTTELTEDAHCLPSPGARFRDPDQKHVWASVILVHRFREFGRAAMKSLFWPNVNQSVWSVTLGFKMADCKK